MLFCAFNFLRNNLLTDFTVVFILFMIYISYFIGKGSKEVNSFFSLKIIGLVFRKFSLALYLNKENQIIKNRID